MDGVLQVINHGGHRERGLTVEHARSDDAAVTQKAQDDLMDQRSEQGAQDDVLMMETQDVTQTGSSTSHTTKEQGRSDTTAQRNTEATEATHNTYDDDNTDTRGADKQMEKQTIDDMYKELRVAVALTKVESSTYARIHAQEPFDLSYTAPRIREKTFNVDKPEPERRRDRGSAGIIQREGVPANRRRVELEESGGGLSSGTNSSDRSRSGPKVRRSNESRSNAATRSQGNPKSTSSSTGHSSLLANCQLSKGVFTTDEEVALIQNYIWSFDYTASL